MYNKVIITDVFKRGFIYECNTEQDFKEYIEKNNDACESIGKKGQFIKPIFDICLLYTSPSPRDRTRSRMPSSA